MMIRKAVVFSFAVLLLPSLSYAECADEVANAKSNATPVQCSDAKAVEVTQSHNTNSLTPTGDNGASNGAVSTTAKGSSSSRNNKRRAERQFPRFETADPRDTVLSSEICVYSSATYTYTCR
jgi:hypothetical protein